MFSQLLSNSNSLVILVSRWLLTSEFVAFGKVCILVCTESRNPRYVRSYEAWQVQGGFENIPAICAIYHRTGNRNARGIPKLEPIQEWMEGQQKGGTFYRWREDTGPLRAMKIKSWLSPDHPRWWQEVKEISLQILFDQIGVFNVVTSLRFPRFRISRSLASQKVRIEIEPK